MRRQGGFVLCRPVSIILRYLLEYALFRLFGALIQSLPLAKASALGGLLWRWLAPFSKRHRRALAHIQIAYPDLSEPERERLARQMWDTMGRVFAESFRLQELATSDRVTIEDEEKVKKILSATNGYIACTAHQGNWEVAVAILLRFGHSPMGIYRRIKNPYVEKMVRQLREPLYPAGLVEKGRTAALTATKHVRNGGVLSVMADLRENRGVRVPFFGREAASTPFPAMVALSFDKPLFVAHVLREKDAHFRIQLEEVPVVRTGDREADVIATTANLQAALERNIRERPGEWMWGHRRWG